jgi:hypothetical protein
VALLRRDHERVSDLISQLERAATRSGSAARFLLEIIRTELHIHCAIERELFYPAFRGAGRRADDAALYWEALEHDRLVDLVLPGLAGHESGSPEFAAKVKVLKHLIERHVLDEERGMFRRVRRLMSADDLARLGRAMGERKIELTPPLEEARR